MSTGRRRTGVVRWYSVQRGYGFIQNKDGLDVFFHYRALPGNSSFQQVLEGDRVEYIELEREQGLFTEDIVELRRV